MFENGCFLRRQKRFRTDPNGKESTSTAEHQQNKKPKRAKKAKNSAPENILLSKVPGSNGAVDSTLPQAPYAEAVGNFSVQNIETGLNFHQNTANHSSINDTQSGFDDIRSDGGSSLSPSSSDSVESSSVSSSRNVSPSPFQALDALQNYHPSSEISIKTTTSSYQDLNSLYTHCFRTVHNGNHSENLHPSFAATTPFSSSSLSHSYNLPTNPSISSTANSNLQYYQQMQYYNFLANQQQGVPNQMNMTPSYQGVAPTNAGDSNEVQLQNKTAEYTAL